MNQSGSRHSYLLVLGDRVGLAWVLANESMAFTSSRAADAARLREGDTLFLYTSRGCFHNPTRDRGRVIGEANVRSELRPLAPALHLASREFSHGLDISVKSLAPFRTGFELADLVPKLESLGTGKGWAASLRRPLVPITQRDAVLIRKHVTPFVRPPDKATLTEYLTRSQGHNKTAAYG